MSYYKRFTVNEKERSDMDFTFVSEELRAIREHALRAESENKALRSEVKELKMALSGIRRSIPQSFDPHMVDSFDITFKNNKFTTPPDMF